MPEEENKKINILIVDDESDVTDMLSSCLKRKGYSVITAATGEEAISIVSQTHFDIVFLDIVLPQTNGIQVLDRIKKTDAGIDVLMMTAHGTLGTIIESMRRGASDFIDKPLTVEKALDAVEKCLVSRQSRSSGQGAADSGRLKKFVSSTVHDLNNPLMVISGRAQLSLMEDIQNEDVKKNLNMILEECRRAKEMLQKLHQQYTSDSSTE